jgi:hypothetical protein
MLPGLGVAQMVGQLARLLIKLIEFLLLQIVTTEGGIEPAAHSPNLHVEPI